MPHGTPKRQLEVNRLAEVARKARASLADGLASMHEKPPADCIQREITG